MTPVRQTIFASAENEAQEIYGNCMQACVASMFDLALDAVPHFAAFNRWEKALAVWAGGRGYDVHHERTDTPPQGLCMVGGTSPRGAHLRHAVVYDRGRMTWDPHPSGEGLVDITDVWTFS